MLIFHKLFYNNFMKKIKPPAVAGSFYSENELELKNQLKKFEKNSLNSYKYKSKAVIVPHAGLVYSGQLAYDGLKTLKANLTTLFIFAPAHRKSFDGLSLSDYDFWQTPLGNIEINQKINFELEQNFNCKFFNQAFETEHAIEIQLPIIQTLYKNAKIVPILVGNADFEVISQIINHYYKNETIGFIISSDLSHFLNAKESSKVDNITANMLETGDFTGFHYQQACGALGILGLASFANSKKYSLIRIGLINSSNTTGDTSSVVGYGSWFLYENSKNEFLKKYYSDTIIKICRNAISEKIESKNTNLPKTPSVFEEKGACFVTLEKSGQLRGCIGSIIATCPLIKDLIKNAQNAALNDNRFNPVTKEELNKISIAVSLLSEPEKIEFKNETELLSQIVPFKDGIIIKDGSYQAVYLPSVWEQIPDKIDFLMSLKIKAGLPIDYFSKTFESYRFGVEYIK